MTRPKRSSLPVPDRFPAVEVHQHPTPGWLPWSWEDEYRPAERSPQAALEWIGWSLQRLEALELMEGAPTTHDDAGGPFVRDAHRLLQAVRDQLRPEGRANLPDEPSGPHTPHEAVVELRRLRQFIETAGAAADRPGGDSQGDPSADEGEIPQATSEGSHDAAQAGTVRSPVSVDVATCSAIFQGQRYDLRDEQPTRWLKVLADHPGEWISGSDLEDIDEELTGARTDRLHKKLPSDLQPLVESARGKGSRLKLA